MTGKKVKLSKWPTLVKPVYKSKEQYQELLASHVEKLSSLQHLHYASNRYALLLIFQGMDAGGKDGAIRHVMSGVNPERGSLKLFLTFRRMNSGSASSRALMLRTRTGS